VSQYWLFLEHFTHFPFYSIRYKNYLSGAGSSSPPHFTELIFMTRCGDIMKPNPVSRTLSSSVQELANILKCEAAGPLAIVDDKNGNKLLGVVTCRDLVVEVLAQDKDATATKALDVLSHEKQFCKADDSISRAITLMDKYHVTELPVVDSGMHLVGTITQADIAKRLEDPELPMDASGVHNLMEGGGEEVRTIL
jgi:CBS domain-containing protein